jgi:hypothetical protein
VDGPKFGQVLGPNRWLRRLYFFLDYRLIESLDLFMKLHTEVQRPVKWEFRVVDDSALRSVFYLEIQDNSGENNLDFLERKIESNATPRAFTKSMRIRWKLSKDSPAAKGM